uniref:Regulator of chromosome condensation (RCC1), domain containing protein n=3 Tax=Babesia bovis TaxID=5865 RepID=A7AWZ7_BABBO|eukprot:XP_001609143.1 regulator of chromosome condensation (RCC1), domain containing protein [Babesia bovis T2Bo]
MDTLDGTLVKQVSCGDTHSACIDHDGKVYTWGCGKGGKLGHKILLDDVLVPTVVESLSGNKIIQVECGTAMTLALDESGIVYQWGAVLGFTPSSSGTLPYMASVPREVTEAGQKNVYITAGPYSCAAVSEHGDLKTWGVGSCFRLGHGTVNDQLTPKFVATLRSSVRVDDIKKITTLHTQDIATTNYIPPPITANERRISQVSVGLTHGALLTCNGTVYAWGASKGIGYSTDPDNEETYNEPRLINHFSTKIKKIACGSNHTLVTTVEGMVLAWGANDSGQLGLGDLRPRSFPEAIYTLECGINVFAGLNNSCCITTTKHDNFINDEVGTAWVFGSASGGKLGLGEKCTANIIMTPRKINYVSGVYKVVLGHTHSLLLKHDGAIYATGAGSDGKLGLGDIHSTSSFTKVNTDLRFIDIAVGASHSLAISMEHDLYGWGAGKYITKGNEVIREPVIIDTLPSQVGIPKVHEVVAFAQHSLVVTDQGHLIAWGDNSSGQLGVPIMSKDVRAVEFIEQPSLVLINSPVTSVATSRFFSACMTLNGDGYAWGVSSDGRLGIGETHNKVTYEPTAIATINLMGDMINSFDDPGFQSDMASYATAVESFIDELNFRDDKQVVDWNGLQLLLKNEERVCWELSLKAFEDDLVKCLKQHVDTMIELHKRHDAVGALKLNLETTIQGFVNKLPKPKNNNLANDNAQFAPYTSVKPYLEKLIEILFLQPAYFVRLCLFGNDIRIVEAMTTHVYKRMDIQRVHNQFIAMLMTLLREEIQLFFNPQAPLNASSSPFAIMLRSYTTTKLSTRPNAMIFYSPDYNDSMLNFMKQCPLTLPNKATTKKNELGNFAKFIMHLNKVLSLMVVPKYAKVALKRMHNMIKFKIPPGWALPNVPLEDVSIYPLIPTFVYTVVHPYFSEAELLSTMHGYRSIDNVVAKGFKTVAEYFDYIVNPQMNLTPSNSEEVNRMTMTLYRNIAQMLLEYIKKLLNVEDTFNIDLTMETFKSHFDLEKLHVNVPSWIVANFLNICINTKKHLNLSAHDPLCKTLESIQSCANTSVPFAPEFIQMLKAYNKQTSVKIEHRFLVFDKSMSICRFTGVFLPQRLAYRQTTYSEDCIKLVSLVVRYVPYGKYEPLRVIQNALSELKQIDAAPGGFEAITEALENVAECYSQLPVPDYAGANRARDACAQLLEVDRKRTTPCDVAINILKKVLERHFHRKYLVRVYQRQGEIEIAKMQFAAAYREECQYLALCANHANKLFVEPRILNAALVHKVKLYTTKMLTKATQNICESVVFNLSSLQQSGQILFKAEVDIAKIERIFLVFQFYPKAGCLLSLQEKVDDKNEMEQIEACEVPLYTLETWSEEADNNMVELFINQNHPNGILGIRKKFLVQTFKQIMD